MILVQPYIPPQNQKIYRVWFLLGKVQCAVERTVTVDDKDKDGISSEFTNGCAGSTCSIRSQRLQSSPSPPTMTPWKVPMEVQREMEQQLLPLLSDAHCGSVEFLYDNNSTTKSEQQPQSKQLNPPRRLYFDLNLLSTLPVNVNDPGAVWGPNNDPWQELADAIWKVVL